VDVTDKGARQSALDTLFKLRGDYALIKSSVSLEDDPAMQSVREFIYLSAKQPRRLPQ